MNPRTVLTLADGRSIDLLAPEPSDFQPLDWAAEHLAKENRYSGATPGICYSVAQHSVECARVAMVDLQDSELAAYLSLHDVHEALLKDDTTPKKRAIAAIAEKNFGLLASQVLAAFDSMTDRHDAAIHEAAGLAWPPSPYIQKQIKRIDRKLLVTEWRDLMGGADLPNAQAYADVQPLTRKLVALPTWQHARDQLLLVWRNLLPALQPERV